MVLMNLIDYDNFITEEPKQAHQAQGNKSIYRSYIENKYTFICTLIFNHIARITVTSDRKGKNLQINSLSIK